MSLLQNFDMQQRPMASGRLHDAFDACIGLIKSLAGRGRFASLQIEIDDYRRLERICRQLAEQSTMPQHRTAMLIMAERYGAAANALV